MTRPEGLRTPIDPPRPQPTAGESASPGPTARETASPEPTARETASPGPTARETAASKPAAVPEGGIRYREPDPAWTRDADARRPGWLGRLDRALAGALVRAVARLYLRKPDVADLLAFKIRGLGAVRRAIGNELAFRLGRPRSHRLTSVNLEITNACNLACTMCPVNTTMRRPKRMMPFELYRRLLDENPDLDFVLPFQWGEPMLHKDFFRMIAYARSKGIRVMATTNGTLLGDDADLERLAGCGLERITFSSDGVGETHTRIRGYPFERLRRDVERFRRVRDRTGSPTRIDVSMVLMDPTTGDREALHDAWRGIADRIQMIPLLTEGRRERPCREPWRGSIVVLADGTVTACCADPEGQLALGDATKQSLGEIWNGPRMAQLRRRHAARDFPEPCAGCDEFESDVVSKRFG